MEGCSDLDFWNSYDEMEKTIIPFGNLEVAAMGNFDLTSNGADDDHHHLSKAAPNVSSSAVPHRLTADGPPDAVPDLKPVDDSTVYPFSSVGAILLKYQDDKTFFMCSAYIVGERKLITSAHTFQGVDVQRAVFVPQIYNARLLNDERNHHGYFPIDKDAIKYPQQDESILEKIKSLFRDKPVVPEFEVCTAEIKQGSKFNNFEEAQLKPIQIKQIGHTFDNTVKNIIVGCVKQEDDTVTMNAVDGTIFADLGSGRLIMNKTVQVGMSGGPWLIGESAVGVQTSTRRSQSSYSPIFTSSLFNFDPDIKQAF